MATTSDDYDLSVTAPTYSAVSELWDRVNGRVDDYWRISLDGSMYFTDSFRVCDDGSYRATIGTTFLKGPLLDLERIEWRGRRGP